MRLFLQTDLGMLYCGDALKILPRIKERAKLLVADFPFRVDGIDSAEEYTEWAKDVIDHFDRLVRKDGFILVINNPYNLFRMSPLLQDFRLLNELILIKGKPHKVEGKFAYLHNTALLLTKRGGVQLINDVDDPDVMLVEVGYEYDGVRHPAALTEDFFETIIKATTKEGDLVIDVFSGSGTVPVVCERLNRRWIGIEIKPKYCEMTVKRMVGR